MGYDVTVPGFRYDGSCRHWEFFSSHQVHLDDFKDTNDYLMAMALACLLEMHWATEEGDNETQGEVVPVEVGAFGPLCKCFTGWPKPGNVCWKRFELGEYAMAGATGIVVGKKAQLIDEDLHSWTYGRLEVRANGTEDAECGKVLLSHRAILIKCESWLFITDMTIEDVKTYQDEIVFVRGQSVLNYVRRFGMIERAGAMPFIQTMASRSTKRVPHGTHVQDVMSASALIAGLQKELDEDQFQALSSAVCSRGIALQRGPFGCGKTTTIVKIVAALRLVHPNDRIAIVSETNAAVDEDLERLVQQGDFEDGELVRLGECASNMLPCAHVYLKTKQNAVRAKYGKSKSQRDEMRCELARVTDEVLRDARVVIATLSQLAREVFRHLRLHIIINDEGAQTPEVALIQAIRDCTHTVIVAGDEAQLKGYTSLPESLRHTFVPDGRYHKLTWSLMHSVTYWHQQQTKTNEFPGVTIRSQRRCHSYISRWLQPFYSYELLHHARESDPYLADMRLPGSNNNKVIGRRIGWISPTQTGDRKGMRLQVPNSEQLSSIVEVALVVELVLRIRCELKAWSKHVRQVQRKRMYVITPYQHQRALLEEALDDVAHYFLRYLDVTVITSDSVQGRESNITVVSMVRSKTLGFLSESDDRMLVTLSRAKDYVFVVANTHVMCKDPMWRRLHEVARLQPEHAVLGVDDRDAAASFTLLRDRRRLRRVADVEA